MNWVDRLAILNEPCVIVVVAQAEGSTPREAGARMIITADAQYDTIGGGNLEFKAIERARRMLAEAAQSAVAFERYALGPSLGQCCGGAATLLFELSRPGERGWIERLRAARADNRTVTLQSGPGVIERVVDAPCVVVTLQGERLIEPIRPIDFHVALCGAGHVGHAIASVLGTLACRVTWLDEREAQFPANVPDNVERRWSDSPAMDVDDFPVGTYYLVMTHSHALDQAICEQVLRRGDFAYLGLIGSATKRATFERRLTQRGITRAQLDRMVCPIGIDGIGSKVPAVIAISVVAQLLVIRGISS